MDHDLRGEMSFWKGLLIAALICVPLWVTFGFACYYKVHG